MSNKEVTVSFENYCEIINDFAPCMDQYLYAYDLQGDSYYISENALERFRIPSTLFHHVVETHQDFVYPQDFKMLETDLQAILLGKKEAHDIDYRWIGIDGEPIWINCRGQLIRENGQPKLLIGCVNEIGRIQRADNISGLLASTTIRTVLDGFFKMCPNGYVMRIGLDEFSELNEKHGQEYGDYVLKMVGQCLSECIVPGQEVYRGFSDEFLICDYLGGTGEDVYNLFKKIRGKINDFIESTLYRSIFTFSAGVLFGDNLEKTDYNEIMKLSQFALNEAKNRGRNQLYVFAMKDYEAFIERQRILTELTRSVSHGFKGFSLFYQPIMMEENGVFLYAAEGLLRFKDSEGVIITPGEFVPILEESGLIIPVGKYVLREAARTCKEVREVIPDFKVSVNLSYVQIMKSTILEEIFSEIEKYHLEPNSLIIELTESGYFDATPAIQKAWSDLREYGVMIAIDDFGTGYSNLQSISKMSPNIVKVDRDFTARAMKQNFEKLLMKNIVDLVHGMDLKICVEGIETNEELAEIRKLHPDFIQGFYYGKPCDKEDFFTKFVK